MEKKSKLRAGHIATIFFGLIFISIGVFHEHLWFDETYSVAIAKHSFVDIWNIGGNDVHPVLYYWLLHIVGLIFSNSIMAYRIFSMCGIAVLGILGYTHIRKDFGEKTGFLFSYFTFFMAEMANFACEIRMYAWGCTIVTICAIYAYRIYMGDSKVKNWIIFFLSSLCSLYIHYYGLIAAGVINLFLLICFFKNKRMSEVKRIIFIGVIQVLAYVPWLLNFVEQVSRVSGGFWITLEMPKSFYELFFFQMTGSLDRPLCALFIVLIYREIFAHAKKMKENKYDLKPVKLASAVYGGVIGVTLIMTIVMTQPVLYYRYVFLLSGLFIFVISYILAHCDSKRVVVIICTVVGILGVLNNVKLVMRNYHPDNGNLVAYLNEHVKKDDQIIYENIALAMVPAKIDNNNQIFYNEADWGVEEAYKAYSPNMETHVTVDFIDTKYNRVWILDSENHSTYNKLFGDNPNYRIVSSVTLPCDQYAENTTATVLLLEKVND